MHKTLGLIAGMGDEIELMPGHDYGDVKSERLGRQKSRNPYLQLAGQNLATFAAAVGG